MQAQLLERPSSSERRQQRELRRLQKTVSELKEQLAAMQVRAIKGGA